MVKDLINYCKTLYKKKLRIKPDESTFAEAEPESNPESANPDDIESINEDELSEV